MLKLGFKCNNGVFTRVFQRFQLLVSYSSTASATSSSLSEVETSSSLVNYLVNSLGFSKQQSLSNCSKLTTYVGSCNPSNFIKNADSVIQFFRKHGFELSQIRIIVCKYPRILSANVDKTLKPKFKILEELGFSSSDSVRKIVQTPAILHKKLDLSIKTLSDVFGSDENVVLALKRIQWGRLCSLKQHLIPNVKLMQNYGIPIDLIRRHVIRHPNSFIQRTQVFSNILDRVEREFGIPRDSINFLTGVCAMAHSSVKCVELKIDVFKSFGWTHSDVMAIIRKDPLIVNLSEANIKEKLEFFMNELGYEPAYLLSIGHWSAYSMEKRILPRHKVLLFLKEKGLLENHHSLCGTFPLTEANFVNKFVLPYKEVHEVYAKLTAGSSKMLSQGQAFGDATEF